MNRWVMSGRTDSGRFAYTGWNSNESAVGEARMPDNTVVARFKVEYDTEDELDEDEKLPPLSGHRLDHITKELNKFKAGLAKMTKKEQLKYYRENTKNGWIILCDPVFTSGLDFQKYTLPQLFIWLPRLLGGNVQYYNINNINDQF